MNYTDPKYYRRGNVQLSLVASEWGLGYHLGLILKYTCRAGLKDPDPIRDLRKALAATDLAIRAVQHGHRICFDCLPRYYWPADISELWELSPRRSIIVKMLSMAGTRMDGVALSSVILTEILELLKEEIDELETD